MLHGIRRNSFDSRDTSPPQNDTDQAGKRYCLSADPNSDSFLLASLLFFCHDTAHHAGKTPYNRLGLECNYNKDESIN